MRLGLGNSQKAKRFRKFVTRSSTKFDGTDDFVDTGFQPDFIHTNATMSYWVKMGDLAGAQLCGTHNGKRFYLGFYNATAAMGVQNTNNLGSGADISSYIAINQWHHIAMVAEGGVATFYLDGVARDTLSYTQDSASNPVANLLIGAVTNNGSTAQDFMNGSIDEFAVFSSALTAREIDALYNNGRPTKIRTNPNLALWDRMGEGKLDGKSDGDENLMFDQGPNGGLGSEKISDGEFSDTLNWLELGDAVVENGVGTFPTSTSNSFIIKTGAVPATVAVYKLQYDVVSTNGNTLQLAGGSSAFPTTALASSVGTHSVFVTSNGTKTNLQFNNNSSFIGSIDNVSLREVQNVGTISGARIQADGGTELVTNGTFDADSDWAKSSPTGDPPSTATISGGTANFTINGGDFIFMNQSVSFVDGSTYKLTATVNGTAGKVMRFMDSGANNGGLTTSNGAITMTGSVQEVSITFTANSNSSTILIARQSNSGDYSFTVDDLSVKEVTESVPKQCKNLPSAASLKSLSFDGTDDVLVSTIPVLGDTHTISAWFNTTAGTGGMGSEATIVSYLSTGGGGDDSVLSVAGNKLAWSDFVDDDQFGTSTVNDGVWHHGVVVVTATDQKLYVDGVLEKTTTNSYSGGTSFSAFAIGRRADNTQRYFVGNLDEVAIWDTALDGDAVKALYNAGEPTPVATNTGAYDIYRDNLQAYYKMGDATNPAADGTSNLLFDQTNPGVVEMITNGDFSNGTTDWATISGGALSVVNGRLRVTSSGSFRYAYQAMTTRVGGVYSVTLEATKGTSPNYDSFVGTGLGAGNLVYLGAGGGSDSQGDTATQSGIFTATTTTSYLMLRSRNEGSVTDAFTDFDNVSVKEYNGHTGTINGATIQTEAPKQIYALPPVANTKSINFDGTNDHLVTQVDSVAQLNNESRYYSFWAKASNTGASARMPIFSHGNGTTGAFFFHFSSSQPKLFMATNVSQNWVDNSAQDDGEWHHWTVKIKYNDITGCELWCDGVKQTKGTTTNSGDMNTYSSGITLGSTLASGHYFNGSIDEFSIHEDLDDEAIRALFNRGRPIDVSSGNGAYDVSDKALHWWRMGDATSPAADGTNDIIFQGLEAESDELVTNGDFSNGNTGWTEVGDFAVSGGSASITSASQYSQLTCQEGTNFLVAGRTYKLEADITSSINNALAYRVSGGVVTPISTSEIADGKYTAHFTMIQNGHFWFQTTGSYTGLNATVDNVSVKQVRGQYIGPELVKADADLYKASTWTSYGGNDETFPNGTAARFDRPSTGGDTRGGYVSLTSSEALTSNLETGCVYKLQFDFLTDDSDAFPRYYDGSSYTNLSAGSGLKVHYFAFSGSGFINVDNLSADKFVQFSNLSVTKIGGAAVMTNMDSASDIQLDTPY